MGTGARLHAGGPVSSHGSPASLLGLSYNDSMWDDLKRETKFPLICLAVFVAADLATNLWMDRPFGWADFTSGFIGCTIGLTLVVWYKMSRNRRERAQA
jgi:hypothetical protein